MSQSILQSSVNIERLYKWFKEMDNELEQLYENGGSDFRNVVVSLDNYVSEKQEMNQADEISFSEFYGQYEWFKLCKDVEKDAMIELFIYYIGERKVMELTVEYFEDDAKLYVLDYLVEKGYMNIEEMIGFMIYLSKNERDDIIELKKLYLSKVSRSELEIENKLLKKIIKDQEDLIRKLSRMSGCDTTIYCSEYEKYMDSVGRVSYPL